MNPMYRSLMQDDEEHRQGPHPRIGEGEGQEQSAPAMHELSMGTDRPAVTQGVDEVVEVPVIFRRSGMGSRRPASRPSIRPRRM